MGDQRAEVALCRDPCVASTIHSQADDREARACRPDLAPDPQDIDRSDRVMLLAHDARAAAHRRRV